MTTANPEHLLDYAPDHLATSVLRSLSRTYRNQFSIGPVRAVLLGVLTFGFVPLWRMRRQFRNYVTLERQQLWHLGEWLRNRRGGEAAVSVSDAVSMVQTRKWLSRLITASMVAVIFGIITLLRDGHTWSGVLDHTYRYRGVGQGAAFFAFWNAVLIAGYVSHVLQIWLHMKDVRRVAERFNVLAKCENVAPLSLPQLTLPRIVPWAVVSVALSYIGALWSVPMALAGASQRRYINDVSATLRHEMMERTRAMLMQHRPAVVVPSYVIHGRRCGNDLCRASLPVGAQYCPRCGASATLNALGAVA